MSASHHDHADTGPLRLPEVIQREVALGVPGAPALHLPFVPRPDGYWQSDAVVAVRYGRAGRTIFAEPIVLHVKPTEGAVVKVGPHELRPRFRHADGRPLHEARIVGWAKREGGPFPARIPPALEPWFRTPTAITPVEDLVIDRIMAHVVGPLGAVGSSTPSLKATLGPPAVPGPTPRPHVEARTWIDVAEQARLIRAVLARTFPGVRFGVRTRRFAGGSAVSVTWKDERVSHEQIEDVVMPYQGRGFDGMIDLQFGIDAYLLPDGSVAGTRCDGTEGSAGSIPAWDDGPISGARLVRFGGWVNVSHD